MAIRISPVHWAAGLGAVVAIGGAALVPGLAGAQTPPRGTPEPAVTIRCVGDGPATSARPATGARPADGSITYSAAVFATTNENFAAELARALGMTAAQVERAIAASQPTMPPAGAVRTTFSAVAVTNEPGVLEAVAKELGVSVDTLAAAVEAAMPDVPECETEPAGAERPLVFVGGDAGTFEAIAQALGNNITGDRVRAAFEAAMPRLAAAGGVAQPAVKFDVEALAKALGISTERLQAAMESILPQSRR
jgi:hypothetical protein